MKATSAARSAGPPLAARFMIPARKKRLSKPSFGSASMTR